MDKSLLQKLNLDWVNLPKSVSQNLRISSLKKFFNLYVLSQKVKIFIYV